MSEELVRVAIENGKGGFLSDELIGVIIGGSIGIVGATVGRAIDYYVKFKNRKYERKEEVYLKLIELTTRFYTEISAVKMPAGRVILPTRELTLELNGVKPKMTLYGNEAIYDCFMDVIETILNLKSGIDGFSSKDVFEKKEVLNNMILEDLKLNRKLR